MTFIDRINQFLRFSFYSLVLITPFLMTNVNHELFEFNKMLFVYFISIVVFLLWSIKMVYEKRFFVRRTLFDIPLLLFLASQIISTVFSMDPHTSFWGYYSRFNGGLLSIICYIFLYYALVSNFFIDKEAAKSFAKRLMGLSLISGMLVTLWGIPSHFGYDPTCMVFGYGLNTKCWTEAFDPMSRIFSTLGQPNWLAAYLAILIPLAMAYYLEKHLEIKSLSDKFKNPIILLSLLFIISFYIALSWTSSQSGFLGLWAGIITFIGALKLTAFRKNGFQISKYLKLKTIRVLALFVALFLVISFLVGNPFPKLQGLALQRIIDANKTSQTNDVAPELSDNGPSLEYNITGSGEIRLIVWEGAIDIFKSSPLIGTGVETFAYAYYKYRPVEHNLTSEWDYLYNKAHNEYLNYLATTGMLGLGTYLAFICLFLFISIKYFLSQKTIKNSIFPAALCGAFVSILVSNFFGFSVVLANLYLFLIPALFLLYTGKRNKNILIPNIKTDDSKTVEFTPTQYFILTFIALISLFWIWQLINYWNADKAYALGYNYNKVGEYVRANSYLEKAAKIRPSEDLYKSELSTNLASLALAFAQENQQENTTLFANRAKNLSDEVESKNPNNIVYYKTRTRTYFTLAQIEPNLLNDAYQTILKAQVLAPTDAKVTYNKALIEEVIGNEQQALSTLNQTLELKANYLDAHYRKAIVLISLSEKEKDITKSKKYKEEAIKTLTYITEELAPDFTDAKDLLKTLK